MDRNWLDLQNLKINVRNFPTVDRSHKYQVSSSKASRGEKTPKEKKVASSFFLIRSQKATGGGSWICASSKKFRHVKVRRWSMEGERAPSKEQFLGFCVFNHQKFTMTSNKWP